jgi:hypothetical protein
MQGWPLNQLSPPVLELVFKADVVRRLRPTIERE